MLLQFAHFWEIEFPDYGDKKDGFMDKVAATREFDNLRDLIKTLFNLDTLYQLADFVSIIKVEHGPTFAIACDDRAEQQVYQILSEVIQNGQLESYCCKVIESSEPVTFITETYINNKVSLYESTLICNKEEDRPCQWIIVMTKDVTELEMGKKVLLESNKAYEALVQRHIGAVMSIDVSGNILSMNESVNDLLLYKENELKSRSIFNLMEKHTAQDFQLLLNKSLVSHQDQTFSCYVYNRIGEKIFVSIHIMLVAVDINIKRFFITIQNINKSAVENRFALHDELTGLWNQHALLEHMKMLILEAKKANRQFAIYYIDLDRFKYFNDILGKQAGDEILKRTAQRLQRLNLDDFQVYHVNSDRFIIILNGNQDDIEKGAVLISAIFNEPFQIEEEDYIIASSIGISIYPNDGEDEETLIKHADTALSQVKDSGKGHYRFYSSRMEVEFQQYILMGKHLRRAIEKNELMIHYQPQVDLKSGEIESFEALLRWNNPKFGNVSPLKFIPFAEETGLIIPIGEWVIDTVCKKVKEWQERGAVDFRVAINISPKQFKAPYLPKLIHQTLRKYDLPASAIEIEITETMMMDIGNVLNILQELKDLGIKISVDDFGTGYSSLNYIKKFPIDILKIDQSFIRELNISQKDVAITKTIIHLAHHLDLEVIAEGVEEQEQVKLLQSLNCQKAQGYYFSRPVSAEEIEHRYFY